MSKPKSIELTDSQAKALKIISDNQPIRPRPFSEKMWPDSDGHNRYSPAGPHGCTSGGGMWLAAGGYLGKLRKKGLVEQIHKRVMGELYYEGYSLTKKGRESLKLNPNTNG